MKETVRSLGWHFGIALGCALGSMSTQAHAQVFQTDAARTALPLPVGAVELGLGPALGYVSTTESFVDPMTGELLSTPIIYGEYYSPPDFPQFLDGDAFTLNGLFKWRGEQIDPIADATTEPGHFPPGCGFQVELVLQGGDCDVALGWYNFTGEGPPALTDIQPLVPKGSTYLNAQLPLAPLAWDNRQPRDLSELNWTPQVFSSGEITANPKYAGGDVAFVMLGDALRACKTDKFSVYEHNPPNALGVPWVTALTYRSKVDPSAIYLAFEDLPMSPADWRNSGGFLRNDADFNDAVFYISGLGARGDCVPSSGGAGAGGAAGSSGGVGEGGEAGSSGGEASLSSAAGAATTSQGGSRAGATSESDGEATEETDGAATSSGGAPEGDRGARRLFADPGCACHVGPREPTAARWLYLALALALARRRLQNSVHVVARRRHVAH